MPPRRRPKETSAATTTTTAAATTTSATTTSSSSNTASTTNTTTTTPATSSHVKTAPTTTATTTGTATGKATATKSTEASATTTAKNNANANSKEEDSKLLSGTETCLHCHNAASGKDNIQVRCDECGGYICNDCHWCHEFQANHEIRVCDRCDAFYCKSCDEMDQCDDCGEVVCGSCSTLLSCKFCGGGLCEDCATACGRCGIVLCSRDAKFAVDCDTCRLSYCLVCLASGSKDPCVRCGHRPSKRMEQLVHLRLKSIYKAFKQSSGGSNNSGGSSRNSSNSNNNSNHNNSSNSATNNNVRDRQNDDPDESDPEALMHVAAAAAATAAKLKASAASSSSHHSGSAGASSSSPAAAAASSATPVSASERLEQYMAEKAKADKAAADLLAELEEEEEQKKSKKSKKKKKKERQQQQQVKQQNDDTEEPQDAEDEKVNRTVGGYDDDDDDDDRNINNKKLMKERRTSMDDTSESHDAEAAAVAKFVLSSPMKELMADDQHRESSSPEDLLETEMDVDPLEEELEQLIEDEDVDGVEALLASVKGVPGRAALRKNAKKALKRFRTDQEEGEHNFGHESEPVASVAAPSEEPKGTRSHTPVSDSIPVKMAKQQRTKVSTSTASGPSSSNASAGMTATRTECVMHLPPAIVGWVIGKGGQRIRDLMEESGARIWIDQDSMGPGEPRMVFVSGHRKNVDIAMKLITELVKKAPPSSLPRQNTPIVDAGGIAKSSSESKPPIIPDAMEQSKPAASSFGLKPRGKEAAETVALFSPSQQESTKAEHVITCDPRFVPLLIGRRGWTIKNIQDSSGARVDIDQTVTPRKITISGKEASVEVAIRMVRDVLSYPHAQLQGTVEENVPEEEDIPAPQPIEEDVIVVSAPLAVTREVDVAGEPFSPVNDLSLPESGMRGVNSPPSSLIMTGDAKSTISASSSLSSTPEPSMASSLPKGNYSQIPPGPMLPPVFGFSTYDPPGNNSVPVQSSPIPNNSFLFPSGGPTPMQQDGLYGMSAAPTMPDPLRNQSGLLHGSPIQQTRGLVGMVGGRTPRPQPYHLGQGATPFPESSGGVLGPLSQPHGLPLNHQPGAFQPSRSGFPTGAGGPPPHSSLLNDARGHSSMPIASQGGLPMAGQGGLWNGIGAPGPSLQSQVPSATDGFQFGAAVDFLQNSKHGLAVHSAPLQGVSSDGMGPLRAPDGVASGDKQSLGMGGQSHAVPGLLSHSTPDESLIVDSLFGPQTSATNDGSLLVPGLHGLSLNKEGAGTDLWGSAGVVLSVDHTLNGGLGPLVTDDSNKNAQRPHFGLDTIGEHHPPHSRFAWGSYADRQQS